MFGASWCRILQRLLPGAPDESRPAKPAMCGGVGVSLTVAEEVQRDYSEQTLVRVCAFALMCGSSGLDEAGDNRCSGKGEGRKEECVKGEKKLRGRKRRESARAFASLTPFWEVTTARRAGHMGGARDRPCCLRARNTVARGLCKPIENSQVSRYMHEEALRLTEARTCSWTAS